MNFKTPMHPRRLIVLALCSIAISQSAELVPSEELPSVSIPQGSDLKVFATTDDHKLVSPTALTPSGNGQWLVTETHRFGSGKGIDDNRYRTYWILDDMASQTTEDRLAMYRKFYDQHPPEYYTNNSEKIRRLVDTTGDKRADATNIYLDGINEPLDGTAAGIFHFNDTSYLACIPHIWALKDSDGDGKVDERKSIQDGFGVRVSYSGHDLNGFAIGPDGRLYATVGDRGFNFTTKEGRDYSYPGQGAVLRFDPDGSNLEVVHTGLRNPKEIAFDKFGHGITVDNNSDQGDKSRIVYIVDGADSGWRMGHQILHSFHRSAGLEEHPINRWMAEKMWEPRNESQPAWILPPLTNFSSGPSGLTYQPGTGYMLGGKDTFFICDYRGSASISLIRSFKVAEDGAGLKIPESGSCVTGVAATDAEFGYDGRLYVTDFIGGWTAHSKGRIFSIGSGEVDSITRETETLLNSGVHKQTTAQLAGLLGHPDQRVRLRAQLALADRPEALKSFSNAATNGKDLLTRLHGTWGLWLLGRREKEPRAESILVRLLADTDAEIRSQAARAYGEVTGAKSSQLIGLLTDDSLKVRFFAALSLSKLEGESITQPLLQAISENADKDLHLRHALTYALSKHASSSELAELSASTDISKRLAAVIALRRMKSPALVRFLSDPDSKIQAEAILSIHDEQMLTEQAAVAELIDSLIATPKANLSPMLQRRLVHSAFRVGGTENAARLVRIATQKNWNFQQRVEALRLLSSWSEPFPVDQSIGKYSPLEKRDSSAIRPVLEKELTPLLASDGRLLENTLNLVDQYDLKIQGLDKERLIAFAKNVKLQPKVRAQSLRSLAKREVSELPALLEQFSRDPADAVAIAAMEILSQSNPEKAVALAASVTQNMKVKPARRQAAWTILSKLPDELAASTISSGLATLSNQENNDPTSSLELVEAAEASSNSEVKEALKSYLEKTNSNDPLGSWKVSLAGGDPVKGRQLFESHGSAQCMRCHAVGIGHDVGGNAGPNLSGVASRGDSGYHLESLIHPSAEVVDNYGAVTLFFENGGFLSGILEGESDDYLDVREGAKHWRVNKSDIAKQSGPNSSMPSMENILSRREVRDIVAYLGTLKDELPTEQEDYKVEAFDPSQAKQDPKKLGAIVFQNVCSSCHGESGEGISPNPPLDGSEWLSLDDRNLIRMQLHGLVGPIDVKGKIYELAMPSNGNLSDQELAAVLSYVRGKWGDSKKLISPDLVTELRSENRSTSWTAAELLEQTSPRIQRLINRNGVPLDDRLPAPEETRVSSSFDGNFPGHAILATGGFFVLILIGLFLPKNST